MKQNSTQEGHPLLYTEGDLSVDLDRSHGTGPRHVQRLPRRRVWRETRVTNISAQSEPTPVLTGHDRFVWRSKTAGRTDGRSHVHCKRPVRSNQANLEDRNEENSRRHTFTSRLGKSRGLPRLRPIVDSTFPRTKG